MLPGVMRAGVLAIAVLVSSVGVLPAAAQPSAGERTAVTSPQLQALQQALQAAPIKAVAGPPSQAEPLRQFWSQVQSTGGPLVEAVPDGPDAGTFDVTFLWRRSAVTADDGSGSGSATVTRLLTAIRGEWGMTLTPLSGTDIEYRTLRLPAGVRLSYTLAPGLASSLFDGPPAALRDATRTASRLDPLNTREWVIVDAKSGEPSQRLSVVETPGMAAIDWPTPRAGVARGLLYHTRLRSERLQQDRELAIYLPASPAPDGAAEDRAAPELLIVFDGDEYIGQVRTPVILDNLIAAGRIAPTVAIFVVNPDGRSRGRQLPPDPTFAAFLAEELLPWIRHRHRVTTRADQVTLAGASFGGLAATHTAFRYPQHFGRVLSQSGSYWWTAREDIRPGVVPDGSLTRWLRDAPPVPVRFYLSAGLLEYQRPREGGGLLQDNRRLRDVLMAKGYALTYREFGGAHEYMAWRDDLAEGLIALAGTDVKGRPDGPARSAGRRPAGPGR